jgi:DNA-binding SARP family transcriptional activator/streptogramin lyase
MPAAIEVSALGPLVVCIGGRRTEMGKGKERLLLVLLALRVGKFVSVEEIVDVLWPDSAPATAREMVRIYVARIRKRLGEEAVATSAGGYALAAERDAVDALRFEQACATAAGMIQDRAPAEAVSTLERALALWRGAPLAGVDDVAFVRDERARLEELRLQALDDLFAAKLELGREREVVAELEALVREHPYRERLRGELMLALYRAGRQTEALDRYRNGRRLLVDELGIEPGPTLQTLERAILTHDPSLLIEAPAGAPPAARPAARPALRRRRFVLAGLGIAAAVTAVAVLLGLRGTSSDSTDIERASVGAIDARTGTVARNVRVGGLPAAIATESAHVWVGDAKRGRLRELDARTLKTLRTVSLPSFPYRLVTGFGFAWIATGYDGTVVRADAARGHTRTFRPEPSAAGRVQLATGFGSLWAASQDGVVARLDPRTLRPSAIVRHVAGPNALAAGLNAVWLAESPTQDIVRIDPRTNRVVRRIPIGGSADGLAVADSSVWALAPREGRVWRIDPKTNSVTAGIDVGSRSTSLAATRGSIWIGSAGGTLSRVDPSRNRIVKTIRVPGPVAALAADGDRVWVAVGSF